MKKITFVALVLIIFGMVSCEESEVIEEVQEVCCDCTGSWLVAPQPWGMGCNTIMCSTDDFGCTTTPVTYISSQVMDGYSEQEATDMWVASMEGDNGCNCD